MEGTWETREKRLGSGKGNRTREGTREGTLREYLRQGSKVKDKRRDLI